MAIAIEAYLMLDEPLLIAFAIRSEPHCMASDVIFDANKK